MLQQNLAQEYLPELGDHKAVPFAHHARALGLHSLEVHDRAKNGSVRWLFRQFNPGLERIFRHSLKIPVAFKLISRRFKRVDLLEKSSINRHFRLAPADLHAVKFAANQRKTWSGFVQRMARREARHDRSEEHTSE